MGRENAEVQYGGFSWTLQQKISLLLANLRQCSMQSKPNSRGNWCQCWLGSLCYVSSTSHKKYPSHTHSTSTPYYPIAVFWDCSFLPWMNHGDIQNIARWCSTGGYRQVLQPTYPPEPITHIDGSEQYQLCSWKKAQLEETNKQFVHLLTREISQSKSHYSNPGIKAILVCTA